VGAESSLRRAYSSLYAPASVISPLENRRALPRFSKCLFFRTDRRRFFSFFFLCTVFSFDIIKSLRVPPPFFFWLSRCFLLIEGFFPSGLPRNRGAALPFLQRLAEFSLFPLLRNESAVFSSVGSFTRRKSRVFFSLIHTPPLQSGHRRLSFWFFAQAPSTRPPFSFFFKSSRFDP